jgi:hypothetical protein
LQAAEREAKLRNYNQIDTEPILCGLFADSGGGAALVLRNLGIPLGKIVLEVDKRLGWQPVTPGNGRPARTAAADRVLNFTLDAAVELHDDYVGTEHLLLGLFREKNGVAARVLEEMGLTEDSVRAEIVRAFPHGEDQTKTTPSRSTPAPCAFSDAEREFHLSIYRLAVDYYKPRIEKRAGVSLGEIAVWEHGQWPKHAMDEISRWSRFWLANFVWKLLFRNKLRRHLEALTSVEADEASQCIACYYQRAIYVSFGTSTPHEQAVATTVVHELSHALWEILQGKSFPAYGKSIRRFHAADVEKYKLLVEGFAVYCEQVWFLDLYPTYLRDSVQQWRLSPDTIHMRGFRQIERLVERHGLEILLEIPKRWRELDVG